MIKSYNPDWIHYRYNGRIPEKYVKMFGIGNTETKQHVTIAYHIILTPAEDFEYEIKVMYIKHDGSTETIDEFKQIPISSIPQL